MPALAEPGDTWGIGGSDFLGGYLIAAAIVIALILLFRKRLFNPPDQPAGSLSADEVAFLVGGPAQSANAALAGLHASGTIDTEGRGALIAVDTPRARAST